MTDRILDDMDLGLKNGGPAQYVPPFRLPERERLMAAALTALSVRSLVWLATLTGAALWGYAVWHPEPLRLVAATGYCVTMLVPTLWHAARN